MQRTKRKERYAGPCKYCQSCEDCEDGICLLLMLDVRRGHTDKKCVGYQPRRAAIIEDEFTLDDYGITADELGNFYKEITTDE